MQVEPGTNLKNDPLNLEERRGEWQSPLRRLRALVLLGGAVRRSSFVEALRRPVATLPLGAKFGVMDLWRSQARRLVSLMDGDRLAVRVVSNDLAATTVPETTEGDGDVDVRFEADPQEFRGTGGVLSDIARDYADDDWILVSSAAQVLLEPLDDLACELAEEAAATEGRDPASVVFFASVEGAASSLFLVRCGALRLISRVGFVDFKEQALPRIAAQTGVRVIVRDRTAALGIRTFEDYTRAIALDFQKLSSGREESGPFAERWRTAASVVEAGGEVHSAARLHDSVVLKGGVVEEGAIVVRSVVCEGGRVPAGQVVVDTLVR